MPHCHILLTLKDGDVPKTPQEIDGIVSAEMPDKNENEELFTLVKQFMVHGPCGSHNIFSPCMNNDKKTCDKHYPMPYQEETISTERGQIIYRRREPEKDEKVTQ